jgi:serine/threonine-protein kinase
MQAPTNNLVGAAPAGRAVPNAVVAPLGRVGRYQLLEPLGAGGMAEVFKARTIGPGGFERQVVIKRIHPTHGTDPEFAEMFVEEARILGLLHHPNVVQIYDLGEDGGALYLALEYVDGPSVSRVLRALRGANRTMPPAIAAYIAREVCRALDYVHSLADAAGEPLRIVHRDVTPSNIILSSTGGLKLLDFGVAKSKRSAELTRAGTVKGKPAYLSPEQVQGKKKIDGRVDLFALGIVLHEMLSLDHLFAGDGDLVTLKKVLEMSIPTLSAKRPDVPPPLEAIVMKALERNRNRRYRSAAAMGRDLDDFVVASGLHQSDVVAFVREIEAATNVWRTPAPQLVAPAPAWRHDFTPGAREDDRTRKDFAIPLRMSPLGRGLAAAGRGPRRAALAGMVLVAAALGVAFGLHVSVTTTKNVARAAEAPAAVAGGAAAARAP